jgi:hypothetical protein
MISPTELQAFINATYAADPRTANARKVVVPKKYGVTFTAIAVGVTSTQQIQISANGDFFLRAIYFRASLAGAAQTVSTVPIPNVRALFTDSGSDEQWSNQAIDLSSWADTAGSGGHDMDMAFPRVISGRSTITVQLTSFEAANTPVIDLTLDGVICKVFT